MNPVPWLQMTNMISYQGLVRTFPKYWMMSLDKKERFLSAEWKGTKEKPLKNNLLSVSIEARADGSDKGYIFLQYNFTNNDICKAEIEGAKKSSL